MQITERQKEILNKIVGTYIESAEPVSSEFLEKKYKFSICPATIRIEMQKLAENGFIFQPHTSAGRVPTDKGYRLFVDNLFEKEFSKDGFDSEAEDWFEEEITDSIKFLQSVTRKLSLISSNLVLGYSASSKILWKDGWEGIIKEPEFEEKNIVDDFVEMIRSFEEEIEGLEINSPIEVYIGKESPFSKAKEFSAIIGKCRLPEPQSRLEENGILAILGPKRMDYDKNIGSLNSLFKFLGTEAGAAKRR